MQSSMFGVKAKESDILRDIQHYLALKGVFHWRVNTGAYSDKESGRFIRFGFLGCSDILAIYPVSPYKGLLWALEVKRPGGKLSDGQIKFLNQVRSNGGLASVIESTYDVEELLRNPKQKIHDRYECLLLDY